MPHSHHSHSGRFCAHAAPDTSPGSMLARAHAAGFDTYHLTEHVPRRCASQLYPEEAAAGLDSAALQRRFEAYLVEARVCQAEWAARGMNVLVGAETEWMEDEGDWWPFLSRVLGEAAEGGASDATVAAASSSSSSSSRSRSKVDFVVGSLHHVHDVPIDFDTATFDKALERYYQGEAGPGQRRKAHLALATDYLEAQYRMLVAVRPEVIGHFDLFRLFDAELSLSESVGDGSGSGSGSSSNSSSREEENNVVRVVRELAWRNICFAASYGALFEINAASVRKGWKSPYPGEEILDMILQAKGRVCLSDDAHAHQQVGLNYHVARDYLCRKGVDAVWVLERDGTVADEGSDEEKDRRNRELSSTPGQNAPTRFRRGARSRRVSDWSTKTSFWSNYPPQQSQLQPQ